MRDALSSETSRTFNFGQEAHLGSLRAVRIQDSLIGTSKQSWYSTQRSHSFIYQEDNGQQREFSSLWAFKEIIYPHSGFLVVSTSRGVTREPWWLSLGSTKAQTKSRSRDLTWTPNKAMAGGAGCPGERGVQHLLLRSSVAFSRYVFLCLWLGRPGITPLCTATQQGWRVIESQAAAAPWWGPASWLGQLWAARPAVMPAFTTGIWGSDSQLSHIYNCSCKSQVALR